MSTKSQIRHLAKQQRRYHRQDLYGQNAMNMSLGDYLTRWVSTNKPTPQLPPAGWYPCYGDPIGSIRWWDGAQWTQGFKP